MTLNARQLVILSRCGDPHARSVLGQLPGSYAARPSELTGLVAQHIAASQVAGPERTTVPFANRNDIAAVATRFHQTAGTLTSAIESQIKLFQTGAPCLRVAHQANTFGYLGVYAQFWLIDIVRQGLSINHDTDSCLLYIIPDYDAAGDSRFRSNRIPDPTKKTGWLPLSAPIDSREKVQYAIPKPKREVIDQWIKSLRAHKDSLDIFLHSVGSSLLHRGSSNAQLDQLEEDMNFAYDRSSSLVEFNAFYASRLVNVRWNIPIVFVPSSKLISCFSNTYDYLLDIYPLLVDNISRSIDYLQFEGVEIPNGLRLSPERLPFWYICPACQTRSPFEKADGQTTQTYHACCSRCGKKYDFKANSSFFSDLVAKEHHFAPKVIIDDLTDILGINIVGGVGYIGNAEHVIVSGLAASRLGWHVPPDCLWRPRGLHFGLAEIAIACAQENKLVKTRYQHLDFDQLDRVLRDIYCGKASILYYIMQHDTAELGRSWSEHLRQDSRLDDDFLAPSRFELSSQVVERLISDLRHFRCE